MEIDITITDDATSFILELEEELENPRGMNAALGSRLQDELKDYFLDRNAQPNKRGWPKQDWWLGVHDATQLTEVSDTGATVTIAHREGFYMRVHGGTIRPREASALTIPNLPEAAGKSVHEYEAATGHKLFRPAGARYLAFSDDGGESVTLAYFLVKQVTKQADPNALPAMERLADDLKEEAEDYLGRTVLNN